jgi:hypothetical protein
MTAKTKNTTDTKTAKKATTDNRTATVRNAAGASTKSATTRSAAETRATQPIQITHEMIALRAYQIWLGSGRPHGQDKVIWLQAEAELKKSTARKSL